MKGLIRRLQIPVWTLLILGLLLISAAAEDSSEISLSLSSEPQNPCGTMISEMPEQAEESAGEITDCHRKVEVLALPLVRTELYLDGGRNTLAASGRLSVSYANGTVLSLRVSEDCRFFVLLKPETDGTQRAILSYLVTESGAMKSIRDPKLILDEASLSILDEDGSATVFYWGNGHGTAEIAPALEVLLLRDFPEHLEVRLQKQEAVTLSMQLTTEHRASTLRYADASGRPLWDLTVRGTFVFDGSERICIAASGELLIFDDSWETISLEFYPDGSAAVGALRIQRRVLGIVVGTKELRFAVDAGTE